MKIVVNGAAQDAQPGLTVRQLIEQLTPAGSASAAEVNKQLVPRRAQDAHVLNDGDIIEVVTLVGGG